MLRRARAVMVSMATGWMNRGIVSAVLGVATLMAAPCVAQEEQYPVPPEAERQAGVPEGAVLGPFNWSSKIFPGTERKYWLYVPAQYDASQPACLMVVQDGLNRAQEWRLPVVMDNLIHQKQMPVTIGLFVDPGVVPALTETAQPRFNRSFEYDGMGPRYARFLIEELLPEVAKQYNISSDPNDRSIAGASSGGVCAFTVAWERPDQFRRVLSTIGTFVGLRGGDAYPTLVRKVENKPIRVFLQDGNHDLNIYAGDWWMANQSMLSALQYAGYDVHHMWGEGGHNGKQGAAIMPEALRWLWRDYPKPIEPGKAAERRVDLVIPGENWQLVSEGHGFTEGPATNSRGEVFFSDVPKGKIHRIDLEGKVSEFVANSPGVNGLAFGADDYLYAIQSGTDRIVRYDSSGKEEVLLEKSPGNDLVSHGMGGFYTDPKNHKVWRVDQEGARVVDEGIGFPNGVITSADQSQLYVANTSGRFIYVFRIQPDGTLAYRQEYGHLHLPDDSGESGADGMAMDEAGRLYVATKVGVQVLDQLGRVNLILEKPSDEWLSNVAFGGPELDTLYATCGGKVYRRKLKTRGVVPCRPAVAQPKPSL
ncbi:MAG: SMP-30/gluconolactonase/LRE family protein [Pirellulales bacterium]